MLRQKRPFPPNVEVEAKDDSSDNEESRIEPYAKQSRSARDMSIMDSTGNIAMDGNNTSDSNININIPDDNENCDSQQSFNDMVEEESQGIGAGISAKKIAAWGVPYCLLLPNRAIGFVIGKNGINIKEIEKMCEATIKCQRDFDISVTPPPSEKRLTIWGIRENKKKALELILEKSKTVMNFKEENGKEAIVIIVPTRSVPFLIGHKGSKISELCEKSACEIQIHKEEVAGIKDKAVIIKSKKTSKIIDCIVMIYDFLETVVGGGVLNMQDFPGYPKSGILKRGNNTSWSNTVDNNNNSNNNNYSSEGALGIGMGGGSASCGKGGYGNIRGSNFHNYSNIEENWKEGWKDGREVRDSREMREGGGKGDNGGGYTFSPSERDTNDNASRISNEDYSCQYMDNFNVPPERNLLLHRLGKEPSPCVIRFVLDVETTAWVIGRSGCHIKLIRATTNAGAAVVDAPDHIENVKKCDRILTLSGSPICKYNALKLIVKEMEKRVKNFNNPMRMLVPGKAASFLIGKKGAIIKNITEQSGSQIQVAKNNMVGINNDGPNNSINNPNNEKLVLISGSPQAKLLASVLVLHKLEEYENPIISRERLTLPLNELVSNSDDENYIPPFSNLGLHKNGNDYSGYNNNTGIETEESFSSSHKNTSNFRKSNTFHNRYANNTSSNYSTTRTFHQNNKINNNTGNASVNENVDQYKNTYKNVNSYKRDSGNHFSSSYGDNVNKYTHHMGGKGNVHPTFSKGGGNKSSSTHNNSHHSNNYHNASYHNYNNFSNGSSIGEGNDNQAQNEFLKEIFKFVPPYALPKIMTVKQPCTIELNMPNIYLNTLDSPNKYGKPVIEEISDRSGCNISISTDSGGASSYTFNLSITGPPLSNSLAILMIQAKIFKFDWF